MSSIYVLGMSLLTISRRVTQFNIYIILIHVVPRKHLFNILEHIEEVYSEFS